ncbi:MULTISPECIES: hypothetical protein [unclassified Streptomyces]|uniref:hypothetical protein n=1 Tax=unclassified Streptomyces TaxID=2593676 RepID=UPI001488D47B|nr:MULTISPECIES: hypothetical protein [unclassified Streptomyces]
MTQPPVHAAICAPKEVRVPPYGGNAEMQALYNKAREAADHEPGHSQGCEGWTNGWSYCSCGVWAAACTGISIAILQLRGELEE